MKRRLYFIIIMLIPIGSISQNILRSKTSKYAINDKRYEAVKLIINNTFKEPIMVWFHSLDKTHDFRRYFSVRNNDFSLSALIYDGLLKGDNMTIGKDFLKIIPSGSKFTIYILSNKNVSENYYDDYITVVKKSQIQSIYKFNWELINDYKEEQIILYENDLFYLRD